MHDGNYDDRLLNNGQIGVLLLLFARVMMETLGSHQFQTRDFEIDWSNENKMNEWMNEIEMEREK